jgi:cyclase
MNQLPRVIPCLLLKGGGFYKSVQFGQWTYVGDPTNTLRIFNDKEADEICILDVDATREGRSPDYDLIGEMASECFMPLSYGGGIKSFDDAARLFDLGIEKVCLSSALFENPGLVEKIVSVYGSQAVTGIIDVKKQLLGGYKIFTRNGQVGLPEKFANALKRIESEGIGEIMINAIHKDGTMQGYDLELVKIAAAQVRVPMVACGGAGTLEDFRAAVTAGATAIAAGSFFVFQGKHRAVLVTYPDRKELKKLFGATDA